MKNNRKKTGITYGKQVLPLVLIIFLSLMWQSCTKTAQNQEKALSDFDYSIDMSSPWCSKHGDSLFVYFKVTDKESSKKIKFEDLDNSENITNIDTCCVENGNKAETRSCIITKATRTSQNQKNLVSKNSNFLFLIDRTRVKQEDLDTIKSAIKKSLEKLPDSTVYISFVDTYQDIKLVTDSNFNEITQNDFKVKPTDKVIQKAILGQFEWLIETNAANNKDSYLLVFTDGVLFKDNDISDALDVIKEKDNLNKNNILIHTFRYGNDTKYDYVFEALSVFRKNKNGRFYSIENAVAISDSIASFMEADVFYDYKLTCIRNFNNDYIGQPLNLSVEIKTKQEGKTLYGNKKYSLGSPLNPISKDLINFFISLFLSLIIIIIIYFIIQVAIPFIKSKRENFKEKYVVKYEKIKKNNTIMELCPHCGLPFEDDEDVVVKCMHKIHYDPCWRENGYRCNEYGRKCTEGIEHHFDKEHAFNLKTGPYYRKWAIAGAIGGLIISVLTYLLRSVDWIFNAVSAISGSLVNVFSSEQDIDFSYKMKGFLMTGVLLGFTLTFLFSWINEYRNKKGKVLMALLLRSLIGAVAGFIAFFIGSLVCILLGKTGADSNPLIDWIPWILFGLGIALCLSVGTTIKMKDAIIGGLISGVISFVCLFTSNIFSPFGMFLSFMLCSASIGIAISAVHYIAQKYFLKVSHKNKSCEIAIHKWMSESGGRNEVKIGKSTNSTIQINWADEEEKEKIHDIQAKLYIDKKRNAPHVTALEEGMQFDGRDARVNDPKLLEPGKTFMIGNTKFEYIEK